jgi:hypothetical membrane protein
MNTASVEDTRIRRLGLVAAAGPIVFVIGWAVGAATQDGFRIIRDDESALAAIGADHPWITMTGDTVLGIGILALSIALAALLDGKRGTIGYVLLATAGLCAIIQALVREDCVSDLGLCAAAGRSEAATWRQPVHDSAAFIAFIAILAAAIVLAGPLRRLGWRTVAKYSMGTGAIGTVLLVFYIAVSESDIAGLAQFLFLLVTLGWVTVLGLRISARLHVDRNPAAIA